MAYDAELNGHLDTEKLFFSTQMSKSCTFYTP